MSGTHHGDDLDHESMPGMMSDDEMSTLEDAPDPAFQGLWVQLMIRHHEGALAMAKTEIVKGSNPDAIALARSIQRGQAQEIATMKALLSRT